MTPPLPRPLVSVFARAPVPGRTKTRLAAGIGEDAAAALATTFLLDVLDGVAGPGHDCELRAAAEPDRGLLSALIPAAVPVVPQGPGDLGVRLSRASAEAFDAGRPAWVAVGADCPGIGCTHVADALGALADSDVAMAPSGDGGYSLLALRRHIPELFLDIPWGTRSVAQATRSAAAGSRLRLSELPRIDDVDRPEDLGQLALALAANWHTAPRTAHLLAELGYR